MSVRRNESNSHSAASAAAQPAVRNERVRREDPVEACCLTAAWEAIKNFFKCLCCCCCCCASEPDEEFTPPQPTPFTDGQEVQSRNAPKPDASPSVPSPASAPQIQTKQETQTRKPRAPRVKR